jgi:transposase-like protein
LRQLINERGIKDIAGVQDLVKELTSGLIQEVMDAELEDELGYSKYDYKNKHTDNSRNGSYKRRSPAARAKWNLPSRVTATVSTSRRL